MELPEIIRNNTNNIFTHSQLYIINKLSRKTRDICERLSTCFRDLYENIEKAYDEREIWKILEFKSTWFELFQQWKNFRNKQIYHLKNKVKLITNLEIHMNIMFLMSLYTVTKQYWLSYFLLFPDFHSLECLYTTLNKCKKHICYHSETVTSSFFEIIKEVRELKERIECFNPDNKRRMNMNIEVTLYKENYNLQRPLKKTLLNYIEIQKDILDDSYFKMLPSKENAPIRNKIISYYLQFIIDDLYKKYVKEKNLKLKCIHTHELCQSVYLFRINYLFYILRFITILQNNTQQDPIQKLSDYYPISFIDLLAGELSSISVHEKSHKWDLVVESSQFRLAKYFIERLL